MYNAWMRATKIMIISTSVFVCKVNNRQEIWNTDTPTVAAKPRPLSPTQRL